MRKPRIIAILITFGILGMVSGLVAKAPPKKVVIKSCQKKRPPVAFDHEKHSKKLKIECKACHHAVKAKDKYQKCITCHAGPDFTDDEFRRIGIGWNGKEYVDPGRGKVTGKPEFAGMFRVPPLRELRWTAPYMHDGSLKTLEEVVEHYDRGGIEGARTDLKGPLKLTTIEKSDLVAFLLSLSSPGLPLSVSTARTISSVKSTSRLQREQ